MWPVTRSVICILGLLGMGGLVVPQSLASASQIPIGSRVLFAPKSNSPTPQPREAVMKSLISEASPSAKARDYL